MRFPLPLPSFLRALVPAPLIRWRRRQLLRRKAGELARLRLPGTSFAELYRAARSSGLYTTLQVESEITGLLQRVHDRQSQTLLEIGTASGGTLYLLTRAASRHATLITLDLSIDPDQWAGISTFALDQQRLVPLEGNSNDARTLERVKETLAERPLDFLLIDGDHSVFGVRQDFALYSPLVGPGGMIAFHDICLAGGVKEFWPEVKLKYRYEELIGSLNQTECGLGIAYV
jgi:predicted O-methyltransferase YrrM